jgi:preprotein translocase subunit SecD
MAKSILSFEEYSSNIKKSKSTAEGNAFGAARAKAIADGEEEFEVDGEKVPVKGVDKEDKENAEEFVEETEDVEDESDDDDDEDDSDDDDSDDDDDEETEKVEEILETCSDHLSKSYEMAIKEAIEYDGDDYPDHTLESYMKENASLVASLSAQSCEDCYSEIKDEDLTKEMYEAILNEMKESYVKKIEEMKESWVG